MIIFATLKNASVKSRMFPHCNIYTFMWIPPGGNSHIQIYHSLIHRRWHTNVLDALLFRVVDYDTGHYLVMAKVRERLAASKQILITNHSVALVRR
jgi:hypothetical protein